MREVRIAPIMAWFSRLEDPGAMVNRRYPLEEVITITILAVMSFVRGWENIEGYGQAKAGWLRKFPRLENGIPKHDVYRRVFCALKPEAVEECFMNWARAIKREYCYDRRDGLPV
ncbi:MAG: transposase family protein [Spirochaetaceae bacterium]|jgi:hypothetical protein|nr:transposase family protein [Spirochaetaceae bacterium]